MVRHALRLTGVVVLALSPFVALRAQQPLPTGTVGEYAPPRAWPQHPRVFDLLHQRIAITPDLAGRSVAGTVETLPCLILSLQYESKLLQHDREPSPASTMCRSCASSSSTPSL